MKLSCGRLHHIRAEMYDLPYIQIPCYPEASVEPIGREQDIKNEKIPIHNLVRQTRVIMRGWGPEYNYFFEEQGTL